MEDILQVINTVGFPIAVCLALGYYIKYMTDNHQKEIESLRNVIADNTKIVTKLYEMMKTKEGIRDEEDK